MPKDLAPRSTVHDYLGRWEWDGTLERIHHAAQIVMSGRALAPTRRVAAVIADHMKCEWPSIPAIDLKRIETAIMIELQDISRSTRPATTFLERRPTRALSLKEYTHDGPDEPFKVHH